MNLEIKSKNQKQKKERDKNYISLKQASRVSGYSPDYIGSLIRTGKIKGEKIHSGVSWQIKPWEIIKYCKANNKTKNLNLKDSFYLVRKKYVSLREASKISGYSSDYIGSLLRAGKIKGRKTNPKFSLVTTEQELKNYQLQLQKARAKVQKGEVQSIQEVKQKII